MREPFGHSVQEGVTGAVCLHVPRCGFTRSAQISVVLGEVSRWSRTIGLRSLDCGSIRPMSFDPESRGHWALVLAPESAQNEYTVTSSHAVVASSQRNVVNKEESWPCTFS